MSAPLLETKLYVPPLRPELVLRPRLVERLNAGLHRKLTLLSAPAGFGKTTLLSEWIAGCERPVAWLSLDVGDNDLARFLAYLVGALQTVEGRVGQGLPVAAQSPGLINVEPILTTLLNEIASLPGGLALVLDDYHAIESAPIDDAITFLLGHLPPQMHLVIATRTDPTLPLSRLRARGQLTELRADDLRFTAVEAAAFFEQATCLSISSSDVHTLERRTEGWITGLQLAAVAMHGIEQPEQIARFVHSFGASHRYVIDYLVDEVLDQQTPQVQAFLLRTSILDRMTASLCDALCFGVDETTSGCEATVVASQVDSQVLLERLEAANLFLIPLDGERSWFRYHHLFADLLRQRFQQQQPDRVAELHIRASGWYERNGLEVEALHHAAAAGDFARAARLVEGDGSPLYHRGAVTPVLNWLSSLPASLLDANPSLWVMYAEVSMTSGQPASAESKYRAAEAALRDAKQDADTRDLLGRIANGRAGLAGLQHQPERIIALSRRALDLLHPKNLAIRAAAGLNLGYAYRLQGNLAAANQVLTEAIANGETAGHIIVTLLATICLGDIQVAQNRIRHAAQTYQRALEQAGEQPIPYAGEAHLGLAQILYEWNDLDRAQHHGERGLQLTRQIEHTDKPIACEVFLARLKLAQGDVAGASALLEEASQSAQQHHLAACMPDVAATQVLVLLHQGDLATAAQLAQAHDLPIGRARVHLAQGDAAGALVELEPHRRQMEAQGWQAETLKAMVLQAIALHRMQHAPHGAQDAVQLLGRALALAEPGGLIRTFVDEGASMAQLLRLAAARGMTPGYTAKLLAAFAAEEQQSAGESCPVPPLPSQPLVEPLSPRELEVLQLVAQGLSNREIGDRLFLALATVKGHNRRIYAKLQVQRRTEAVARARELGLL